MIRCHGVSKYILQDLNWRGPCRENQSLPKPGINHLIEINLIGFAKQNAAVAFNIGRF